MVDISVPPLTGLTPDRCRDAARFTESAALAGEPSHAADTARWLAERRSAYRFDLRRVPFAAMPDWFFEPSTGNLAHRTGRFFSVEGVEVVTNYGPVGDWTQPIINQPEIGVLGMLTKEIDGVLHCLVQAKMEPGNINTLQLSPTVQATRSNYSRVHRGAPTRYLEYFTDPRRARVLVDVLQSEQGAWFFRKRNRNIVVETTEEVPPHEDYRWMTIGQLRRMLHLDNMVNMDLRTVLSCIPFAAPADAGAAGPDTPFRAALRRSLDPANGSLISMPQLLSWFTDSKTRYEHRARPIPLRQVRGWHRDDHEISHSDGRHFRIIATEVAAGNREVVQWSQPLLAPRSRGVIALLTKAMNGVLHVLVHARVEAGFLDVTELAPTVQCMPDNYAGLPPESRPPFLEYVLDPPADRIRYDTLLSEEGGRFYHAESRYLIIEVDEAFPVAAPAGYRWLTVGQLGRLLRHSHYVNVQARSLIACLHSLW
jgi:oxidase EvaA